MEKSFPFEKFNYKGVDYINMKSDIFYSFFLEIIKYAKIDESIIKEIIKRYEYAKSIKKNRIKLKKEKQALILMYDMIVENFIK